MTNHRFPEQCQKSLEEAFESAWKVNYNHPKPESIHEKKIRESWTKLIKKDPILVIDLDTLKLRPPKYK